MSDSFIRFFSLAFYSLQAGQHSRTTTSEREKETHITRYTRR